MKKVMLLTLGVSLFAVSCKKQETQNENSMNDSAATGTMTPDNTTTGTAMDTTASVRDSAMNQGSGTNNQTTSPNQTTGSNRGTQNSTGTGSDSVR
ncbi:hypothetical protein EG349_16170 [Chryseobacterium shandongense]|jgi:hypothetical protein|uniref:Cytochrome C551 n=1 Tax=Chryseobacterium shandongense TaxID=1493872 RepID=A0A3G6MKK8_9FLAO|nr:MULTISPECIES: hypothetical protein [Chryseobacterium]AZA56281.1 hypothetical protein EG350_03315 [Chryseobacterium shandongense]AZA88215.1 hypothetical protein EG349_16170 [Chryseobacterium shandongense]AZA96776.1 hypothetical protein EG353_14960 [Chryseobacterium shandongense]